jgi:asparagine N-glycosylation enzyme membrane subunit Stt3
LAEQNPRVLRKCAVMLAVALAVRLLAVAFLYRDALNPSQDYWRFGGEVGRIARSIVQGHGFSNPYFADTGPTALEPPLYIYLLAGIFKIFGAYTKSAALAILFLNCMVSALTCIPVFLIGRKSFGEVAGSRAAWAWALFPFSIYFAAGFIWPTVFTTFLLTLLFWIALNLENSSSLVSWGGFGLLYGISALTDPS